MLRPGIALLLLSAALALQQLSSPPIDIHTNSSNIPSQVDPGDEWVKHLGHTKDVQQCADLCVKWTNSSAGPRASRCRSFTRYAASWTPNVTLAGQCYGRVDPGWVPLPSASGGIDSGRVEWPCHDHLDCSLNGKCIAGQCRCNPQWSGPNCGTLQLAPVDRQKLGFSPSQDGRNQTAWGGSVWKLDGQWHMWASVMDHHCGISSYLLNSRVVHAVSQDLLGPYIQKESVVPAFAHEPCVVIAPTGELVLISVHGSLGNYTGKQCQCIDGSTSGGTGTCGCNNQCHPQWPTLSVAKSANGPWSQAQITNLGAGENPSIWITRNGSVYGMVRGGNIAAYAPDWRNVSSWRRVSHKDGFHPLIPRHDVEDPFIFQDADDHWHSFLHNLEGPHMGNGEELMVGTHSFSEDGKTWWYGGLAYTNRVNFTDGSHVNLNRRERPHVVFAEDGRTPIALINSAEVGGKYGDRGFTLVQQIPGA